MAQNFRRTQFLRTTIVDACTKRRLPHDLVIRHPQALEIGLEETGGNGPTWIWREVHRFSPKRAENRGLVPKCFAPVDRFS